jgi:two-component system, sensor histidine kinase and response regulator
MGRNSGNVGEARRSSQASSDLEVWLVNDDPAQLLVQKRLLGRFAATVWEFSSPDELLTQAQKYGSCPNLVSDFHMPGMNGLELAQIWCEMHANARVLLVSASKLSADEEEAAIFLPNNHVKLLTSFHIPELLATVQEWFLGIPADCEEQKTQTGSTLRYFDASVHSKLVMLGGKPFLRKALERFADRLPTRLDSCRDALECLDKRSLHREAHSLKGSCGIVGANALLELADNLEVAAQNEEDSAAIAQLIVDIDQVWGDSKTELEQVLSEL